MQVMSENAVSLNGCDISPCSSQSHGCGVSIGHPHPPPVCDWCEDGGGERVGGVSVVRVGGVSVVRMGGVSV